jgi:hypothetical protein
VVFFAGWQWEPESRPSFGQITLRLETMFQGKSLGETVEKVMGIDRNSKMDLDTLEIPSAVPLDLLVSAAAASTIFQPTDVVLETQLVTAAATTAATASIPPKPAARPPVAKVCCLSPPAQCFFVLFQPDHGTDSTDPVSPHAAKRSRTHQTPAHPLH